MDNPYYGITNAFDDGENVVKNQNYTYWLPRTEEEPFIDVHFDVPVKVTRIEVKGSPGTIFTVRLKHWDGGETSLPTSRVPAPLPPSDSTDEHRPGGAEVDSGWEATPVGSQDSAPSRTAMHSPGPWSFSAWPALGNVELPEPALDVKSIRIEFSLMEAVRTEYQVFSSKVHEVRVLGFPPEGASFEVRKPRVRVGERNVLLSGKAALDEWRNSLFESLTPEVVERDDAFVVTYSKSGKPVFRVSVSKATGEGTTEPLVPEW